VLVAEVQPNNIAAQSGLQSGDVIVAVDSSPVFNAGDFWHAFLRAADDLPAQLTVYGKQGQFSISLPRVPLRLSR
jgi:S1-C subfamily serine protease